MRNRFHDRATRLLLAIVVLAWGFVFPGVRHAHADGDKPVHRHAHGHCHGAHEHDGHHVHRNESAATDGQPLAGHVLHLHWQFFGIDVSMPVSQGSSDGADNDNSVPPVIVRAAKETLPAAKADSALGRWLQVVVCTAHVYVVRTVDPHPRPPNLVASIPLCDSARFERSGVLLA